MDKHLDQVHHFFLCREIVEKAAKEIGQSDECISLDLGWFYALSTRRPRKAVCFLADPLPNRLTYWLKLSAFSISSWKALCRSWVVRHNYYELIKKSLWPGALLGAFYFRQAEELRAHGIPCQYFRYFTPEVNPVVRSQQYRRKLVALHVATLDNTASRRMIDYWTQELFPELARLPFELEIRFVGRTQKTFSTSAKNVYLQFLGHKESLEQEFASADFFLAPAKYPVSIQTRIVTALSYGIPVIAHRTLSFALPELVPDRDIVYISQPSEVREVLERMVLDPSWFQALGRRGRHAWETHYHPSSNVGAILEAIGLKDKGGCESNTF